MSTLDLMLLPFELILIAATAWCGIVLVPTLIGDIFDVMTNEPWQG